MVKGLQIIDSKKIDHIKTLIESLKTKGGFYFSVKREKAIEDLEVGLRKFNRHFEKLFLIYSAFLENHNEQCSDFEEKAGMTRDIFLEQIELHRNLRDQVLEVSRDITILLENERMKLHKHFDGEMREFIQREVGVENDY